MRVILFDIDMTLLDSSGAGRAAMNRAFHALFGVHGAFDGVAFQGRTDRGLVDDALARHGLDGPGHADGRRAFTDVYVAELARALASGHPRVLPGVRDLLDALAGEPGVALGLATGNFRRAAMVKLAHLGLLDRLRRGGFGDRHPERPAIVADAVRAVAGEEPAGVVVVGDTPFDVAGARASRAAALGVATGFHSPAELDSAGASDVVDDLSDTAGVRERLLDLADGALPEPPAVQHGPEPRDREVEAKFALPDDAALESFLARRVLAEGFGLGPVATRDLLDTYFDTADRALLRRGLSLRTRERGTGVTVTVKSLARLGSGPLHSRLELEAGFRRAEGPEDPDPLDTFLWPETLLAAVVAVTGPEPALLPIVTVTHLRHTRAVGSPDARRTVGELAVEHVAVAHETPDGPSEPVAAFRELELELGPEGALAELETLADWLADEVGLAPLESGKLERALRAVADHVPGMPATVHGIQPDMPMSEAGRLVWRRELAEMLLQEAGARLGTDIEHVHRMRVATRRARASTDLFAGWLDARLVRRYRRALRRTGRRLGAVRDLDVALYRLRAHAGRLEHGGRDLQPLVTRWRADRRAAYVRLLAWLDAPAYRDFVADFADFCARPGRGAVTAPHEVRPELVRHVMPAAILERLGGVRAYEPVLAGDGALTAPETTLHALRIACKRLRYALEMVRHLLGDVGEQLVADLKRLQDHLGDLNDAAVARGTIERLRAKGLDGPALQEYADLQQRTIERLRATFPARWSSFVSPDQRDRVHAALARL